MSSILPVIRHDLDLTGASPDNLVVGEPHALSNRRYRVFAPTYGAFYAESAVVRDATTGQPLAQNQYYFGEALEQPTLETGKSIYAVVVISDPTVSPNVVIDYQALGGPYYASYAAIIQALETVAIDNRPVSWPSIPDKPDEFPPTWHLHDIGDLYGFEYLVNALDRLRDAILMGDQMSHNEIFAYIDEMLRRLNQAFGDHLTDYNNPHRTTAHQVGALTEEETMALIKKLQRPAFRTFLNLS